MRGVGAGEGRDASWARQVCWSAGLPAVLWAGMQHCAGIGPCYCMHWYAALRALRTTITDALLSTVPTCCLTRSPLACTGARTGT